MKDPTPSPEAGPPAPNPLRDRRVWVAGAAVLAAIVLAVPIILALTGDSDPEATGMSTTTATTGAVAEPRTRTTATNTTSTLPAEQVDRNPLTGAPLDAITSARVLAVKVDNAPLAKPQIGLGAAEMVIEAPVEGGLTRFTALFFGDPPQLVGPVRSLRTYDADLLAPFLPVLLTTGGQDFVVREAAAAGIELVVAEDRPDLFQALERPTPYHLFASTGSAADGRGGSPAIRPFVFSGGDTLEGGFAAETVEIPFSATVQVEWAWNGGGWVRTENDSPAEAFAAYEGALEPIVFDTIVVLSVAERSAGYTDGAGAVVPTFDVIGFGAAVVLHGGQAVEGEWRRAAQEDGFLLFDESGSPLQLPTGRVFVEVVPRYVPVSLR